MTPVISCILHSYPPCGFPRVLGFSCLRSRHSKTFLNVLAHSWRQVSADLFPIRRPPLGPRTDVVRVRVIWGNFSVVDPLPEGCVMSLCLRKEHGFPGVLCLEVSSSWKITLLDSESEPFHTRNFVMFPPCPTPP